MIVVADASPLRYLVVIGAVDVLQPLYSRVLVPEAVAGELQDAKTPETVRAWIAQAPAWGEIRPDPPSDAALGHLDAGERAAIALALSVDADRLLMDEWDGPRPSAVTCAPPARWASWPMRTSLACSISRPALAQLRRTNFYISDAVVDGLRQRLARAGEKS